MRYLTLLLVCVIVCVPCRAEDVDEDNLDDALEEFLIDLYRPWLYYDSRNDNWPMQASAYVRESNLQLGGAVIVPRDQMRLNPLLALTGNAGDGRRSDDVLYSGETAYKLNPDVPRFGAGPSPVGTYGHCMQMTGPLRYQQRNFDVGAAGDILVQYWQFFAYNDSQAPSCCEITCPGLCDWGDHEGDWLYIEVVVDGATYALKHIVYHHHGDSTCAVSILPGDIGACGGPLPLPSDGIPRCYLEEGSHEWWPAPCSQDCSPGGHQDPCDGAGVNYRTENVLNLGERYRPMDNLEAQLVVLLNVKWGTYTGDAFADPPSCPTHQGAPGFPIAPFYVLHMAPDGYTVSPGTSEGLGAPRGPLARLQDAAARVYSGGTIRAAPGSYSGAGNRGITISTPCTVTAPLGPATIGQ
jgi:hypothetical protein